MRGASSFFKYAVLSLVPSFFPAYMVKASELGNMLLKEAKQESSDASALALEAIGVVINGFRARELQGPKAGVESFQKSARLLKDASQKMQSVLTKFDTPQWKLYFDGPIDITKKLPENDRTFVFVWLQKIGITEVKTRRDVYAAFISYTNLLSSILEKNAGRDDGELYRFLVGEISVYLRAGDNVTRLMK